MAAQECNEFVLNNGIQTDTDKHQRQEICEKIGVKLSVTFQEINKSKPQRMRHKGINSKTEHVTANSPPSCKTNH